jgi:alkylation response protein AidB-like acyl-CoA dehydrogenase
MGMVDMGVVLEEMGRALFAGPFFSTTMLAGAILALGGAENLKTRYLSRIASGESRATLARFGADRRARFVADAGAAEFVIAAGPMDGELCIFVAADAVSTHTPSIDLTRRLYDVDLRQHNLAAEDVIARGRRAEQILDAATDMATAGLAAEMTGGMQRLLEITVAYAKTRKQFGRPIGQFQAVQHLCADMLLMTESARSAAYYACYAVQEQLANAGEAVSIAKSYISDAYREVGNRAIQVHGGMGFTWENDCHLYYRRAKASEIALGDAAYHRERLAGMILDGQEVATVA